MVNIELCVDESGEQGSVGEERASRLLGARRKSERDKGTTEPWGWD